MVSFVIGAVVLVIVGIGVFKFIERISHQITQLSYQNRLLTAVRHLDMVALSTTDVEQLCQEVVNVVRRELGFIFSSIALVDQRNNYLRRIAISDLPKLDIELKKLPLEYKKQVLLFTQLDNFLIRAIREKRKLYTPQMYDVQRGIFPHEISDHLQETFQVKGIFVCPLIAKDKVFGVLYYCTQIKQEKISKFEFDVMDEFNREVVRVLDNAFLYQNLKDLSQELARANQKLKDLDKIKDDFVSIASHELRTPMTAIKSYLWMAIKRPDIPLSEKMNKYLSRAYISTERLINLVNDMLNVSRIESGRIEIRPSSFDILSLTDDVVAEVAAKAAEKRIHLNIFKAQVPKVFADSDKVHQILLNLIGNALKFTPEDGQISVSFFSDGRMLDISVKDSGVGISQEDLPRLFKKFERLDNSYVAAATSGGTGLGLFISKSLVELMQGKIWAQSEGVGKGTTFIFSIPVATPDVLAQAEKYTKTVEGEVKQLEPVSI